MSAIDAASCGSFEPDNCDDDDIGASDRSSSLFLFVDVDDMSLAEGTEESIDDEDNGCDEDDNDDIDDDDGDHDDSAHE